MKLRGSICGLTILYSSMQAMESMQYIWDSLRSEDNMYIQTIVGSSCVIGAIGFYGYILLKKYTMLQQKIVKLENNDIIKNIEHHPAIVSVNKDIKYIKKSYLEHLRYSAALDTKFLLLNDIVNNIEQTQANTAAQLNILNKHIHLLIEKDELLGNFIRTTNTKFTIVEQWMDRYNQNIERINDAHKLVLDRQDQDLAVLRESMKEAPDVVDYILRDIGNIKNEIQGLNTFLLNTARTEAKLNTLLGQLQSLQIIPEHT